MNNFTPAHVSEGHSSTEGILLVILCRVSFLSCQGVVSRMDHPFLPLVRHRVGSLGLFISAAENVLVSLFSLCAAELTITQQE